MTSVRLAAARVLLAVERRRETLAAAIDQARPGFDDRRDRGLLVELCAGALRWRAEIDAVIASASGRSVSTIDPPALAVLRLGVYQLRHLTRVPSHAVVHESVETIRALDAPRAAGFVNAVLRSVLRRGAAISLPARPGPDATDRVRLAYLATTCSHPAWLVARWLARYGFEHAERWCLFNNASPAVTVRSIGRLTPGALIERLREAAIEAEPARFVADAIQLPAGALGRVPDDLREEIWVQDEGSQLVARFVGARPGERVLDVCAAPGGKTLVMAADMHLRTGGAGAALVAGDRRPQRVSLLTATAARAGLSIPVVALDASQPLPFGPVFDRVLLDVPCSGLGALRRDPDLKWLRTEDELGRFAAAQGSMLAHAAGLVRPGGRLVYATCSSEPEENGAVVDAFLAADARFSLVPAASSDALPGEVLNARGALETTPFQHDLDAFFAAMLVRRAAA